jgi:RNA polymerase-binding transcription factor DksA
MQARGAQPRSTLPCPRSGRLSGPQLAELRAMLEEQRDLRREQLAEIDDALARMAAGRYGLCVCCGGPVETPRLEVMPQTSRCMVCHREQLLP